jgi:hypothetical protein
VTPTNGRAIHWSNYFEGFRRYFWQAWGLALLLEQADQCLRVALRNAAVLSAANHSFTVVLAVILLLVATISTLFPVLWVIVTPALLAVVCNKAVLYLFKPHLNRGQGETADGSEPS